VGWYPVIIKNKNKKYIITISEIRTKNRKNPKYRHSK
jgi:hypothetical protein